MSEWITENITWILGTALAYIITFTVFTANNASRVRYLGKRDKEIKDEFKNVRDEFKEEVRSIHDDLKETKAEFAAIVEKLNEISEKVTVILDRQNSGRAQ